MDNAPDTQPTHKSGSIFNPAPVRLFLVRHGEVAANTEMRYLGHRDDPLTVHGEWQAKQVSNALAHLPIVAIISSPLRRTMDTATRIGQAGEASVTTDERLREAAYGTWDGLSRAEVLARSQRDTQLLMRWESDPSVSPPGGESLQVVQTRVLSLVRELATSHAGQSVVLVSHVSPIKALLCAALHVPLQAASHLFLDSATVSVVDWSEHPVVRLFNAHGHLGWEKARWMNQ